MAEGTVGKVQDGFMSRPQPAHSQSLFSKRCSPHWGSWAGMWVSCSKLEHLIYGIVFLQVQKRYKVVPDILCLQSPAAPFCPRPLCSDTPAPSVDLVPWPLCPTQKMLPGSVCRPRLPSAWQAGLTPAPLWDFCLIPGSCLSGHFCWSLWSLADSPVIIRGLGFASLLVYGDTEQILNLIF